MPRNPPGFSPPRWPRLGRRRDTAGYAAGLAPVAVDIPLCWLSQPVRLRLEQPITTASVTRTGAGTAEGANTTARDEYGDYPFTAELHTACDADAENLASWTVTNKATPRVRSPELIIDLLYRTDGEKLRILRLQRFARIRLTGVPPEFPEGAGSLIVAGLTHEIGVLVRRVHITTSPVIGTTPGVAGPWFRLGHSSWGGPDTIPF